MKYSVEILEALDNIYYVDVEASSKWDAIGEAEDIVRSGKIKPDRTIKIAYEYASIEEAA
jgi:hypothetical protein